MRIIILSLISLFALSHCALSDEGDNVRVTVEGNSAFAFDLYQELKTEEGNLFFSPYSISSALAMTYAGARGQTEKEMADVLHFSLEQELLHPSFSRLQSYLNAIQGKGRIKLSIANALWAQEGYRFLDTFLDLNEKYYGAGLNFVDFITQPEVARKAINTWVENRTEQKIREVIKRNMMNATTMLILCNAIYFKGDWLSMFDKEKTREDDFYSSPEKTVEVPMMNQKSLFKFKEFDDFSAIELPYDGNDISMIVFLPRATDGLANFERNFTYDTVQGWIRELSGSHKSQVSITLPKFTTTCEFELAKVLAGMGMPHAFTGADFSGMTGIKDLLISQVVHKAFVDVSEEGTEAAAATGVLMLNSSSKTLLFRADHPFVFLICENATGSILFIGRIVDPTK